MADQVSNEEELLRQQMDHFMLERVNSPCPISEKLQALAKEEELLEVELTRALKKNDLASKLFRDYTNNRDAELGQSNYEYYHRGFNDGIKFIVISLENGEGEDQ